MYIFEDIPAGWGMCSFAHRSFAHVLKLLRTNEQMWGIRSGCSGQMSDCERIAQVAHDKWANVSNLLRSLMINERMSCFFEWIAHLLFCSQKTSTCSKKFEKNCIFVRFFTVKEKEGAIVSKSHRLLTKNEQMRESLTFWANCSFAHFFGSLQNSIGEFPTMHTCTMQSI